MKKIHLLAGWAHPGAALQPMAEALETHFDVELHSADPAFSPSEPCILAGWSLGGMLSMQCAARQPDLVQGLVLIGATPKFVIGGGMGIGTPESDLRGLMAQLKEDVKTTLSGFIRYAALPHRPRVREMIQHFETLQAGLRYLLETDLRATVQQIQCPTLILHGRQDAVIPHGAAEWLAANIRGSKLVSVENMGHDIPLRRAEWVAREIRTAFA